MLVLAVLASLPCDPIGAQDLQFADMGECDLESGEVIRDCRIGYRTSGTLNADKSNAILFPTWFGGRSENLLSATGEDGYVDTSEHFVIMVDAFGNGISSSPSNSPTQGGADFPRMTISDMVRHQHRLLTEELDIHSLRAVMGISMGGMQSFEWAVRYPGFVEKVLPIVGSPRLDPYDIVLWETDLRILDWYLECDCPEAGAVMNGVSFLLTGPDRQARANPRERLDQVRENIESSYLTRDLAFDLMSQLHAMIDHDVSKPYGGSMEEAAERVSAEMLVVVGLTDHIVTPGPALEFAEMLGAETMELGNDCGHSAHACAPDTFRPRVRRFLGR
jgi:homoserine O-acetyltransferase